MNTFSERFRTAAAATHAVVDLDAYAANILALRTCLPEGAGLVGVVKANAYGHGMVPCARAALDAGASWLAVARIEEGLLLRDAGVGAPVLVLGPPNRGLLAQAIRADLALTAGTFDVVRAIAAAAEQVGSSARLHLKVETGLYRYGIDRDAALELVRIVSADRHLRLEAIYSHLATADETDGRFLHEQEARFNEFLRALQGEDLVPPFVHLANSAATLRGVVPTVRGATPLVRTGIASYGLDPSDEVPAPAGFRPVLTLRTRLERVFTLPPGEGVSYGRTHIASRPVRCGTLPIGYGDGLPRHLSNQGWALVRGVVCPIRGRVCMDQTVIEVEGVSGVAEGDEAIIYGDGADGSMTAERAAALCGTINYEITTALSARVPRIFLRHGRPVAVSDLLGLVERE